MPSQKTDKPKYITLIEQILEDAKVKGYTGELTLHIGFNCGGINRANLKLLQTVSMGGEIDFQSAICEERPENNNENKM